MTDDARAPQGARVPFDRRFEALAGLFALSGAAGLVDQVCFSKYLTYIVGSTAYAVSAVLAAFMTGLAVGAWFGGRLSSRVRRPWIAYGVAECLAAAGVAVAPAAFEALTPIYVEAARSMTGSLASLSLLRWSVALALVVIPTMAMGATLPLVAPALAPAGAGMTEKQRRLGVLYAANTFGGAGGALAAAYAVLPALGLSATLHASAALSATVGIAAALIGRERIVEHVEPAPEPSRSAHTRSAPPVLSSTIAFASGFLVFTAEVVCTHLLAVIIGNSAYAFGLILAVFLVCLFAGAALAPRVERRLSEAALPLSLASACALLAMTLPLWDRLPLAFRGIGEYVTSFGGREAIRGLVAFAILAAPVTAMGLTFPLLLVRAAREADVGRHVGRLTAINTVGAVVGALAAGYFALPVLGAQNALSATTVVLGVAAVALALSAATPSRLALGVTAAGVTLAALVPKWDPLRLTAGTNVYFDVGSTGDERVLYLREDAHGGITTVTEHRGERTLYTNGKFQGNTGWEMQAQRYFAHYPSLFVDRFDRALVIGLGTGTTLGTLAAYPWKRLDVVEISPAIVHAARTYFSSVNRGVLSDDPRVSIHHDDARNWLAVHDARFDLISMELSSVWFAGAGNLYSREFYRLVRPHLTAGGIFQQWVQLHHVERPVFARMLNTLRREFAHTALFYGGGQGIVVASDHPLEWSVERARAYERHRVIGQTLPNGRSLETLAGDVLLLDESLDRFLADAAAESGAPLHEMVSTDDNLFLEYETPRGNVLPWDAREALVAYLLGYRDVRAIARMAIPPVGLNRSGGSERAGLRR